MNKLIAIFASLLFVAQAFAAAVNWSTGNLGTIKENLTKNYSNSTVHFFLVDKPDFDLAETVAKLIKGGIKDLETHKADAAQKLKLSGTWNTAVIEGQANNSFPNQAVAYGYAIFFSDDGTSFYISKVETSRPFSNNSNAALGFGGAGNFTEHKVNGIPEPTTAALLALGMMAVGLRRRRRKV